MTTMNASPTVSDQDLEQLTALFRLLSDKTRLNVLMLLAHGERNVSSLCDQLGLPQPTVSHHLGLLRMNNVIGSRRAGKQVFYGLNGRVGVNDGGASLEIGLGGHIVTIQNRASE
jgi:ArsR family transcriptional regulator, zinc-responsive transcriptional repressor